MAHADYGLTASLRPRLALRSLRAGPQVPCRNRDSVKSAVQDGENQLLHHSNLCALLLVAKHQANSQLGRTDVIEHTGSVLLVPT